MEAEEWFLLSMQPEAKKMGELRLKATMCPLLSSESLPFAHILPFFQITEQLSKAGATILDLNTVRKSLSQTKGGMLAETAFPATVCNIMM